MSGDTKLSVLVSLFGWMQKSKSSAVKRSKFRKFLDTFCKPCDYFTAIRLILPSLDRERGTYGLKESVLATCLVDALGMSRDSEDAVRLFNWRRGGPKTGANAGNFAMVAAEVLQRRQGMASTGLTINELNDFLDRLASAENRAEKTSVLSTLITKTNAQEMKWIVMIILKDLKLGISEKSIFHEFHPDAEDLFNVTCDLKLVCERLRDRRQRHKRQDIEVGKPVRPQLAMRIGNAATAWKKLHGKEVVVECKFDGDRIQIHKNGTEVHFFSRNFLDHSEYEHGMSDTITQNILVDRCILDGEMLVWDNVSNRFAEFGSNQEIAKAAREGLDSDRQLCYVAFDILYSGDTSVIHQTLKERHELLRKVVKPVKGRLEILVPDGGLNTLRHPGEPCWSLIVHSQDDVERFFKETIENRDEGIVLKDLGSKWEPGDRSGKWSKLKPEYIRASSDLDVLIIGGYYGSGRRGGEVAQFLVGLAERSASNSYPRRFISFCRVGTGLSDEELDAVVNKLKPHFRKYEYPKKGPPSFYQVTNHSKERPDVWVEIPEKSLIVAITSDIRTISSEVFSAPYSLRFPRIDRVRWDKPWHECLDMQSFIELVQSSNGTTQRDTGYKDQSEGGLKRKRSSEKGRKEKNMSLVPSNFTQTDVSQVKGESSIFSKMMFYFVNVPPNLSLYALHKMVVENGGTFSMNLNSSVTHCIAAEGKGFKFNAATRSKDVIQYSWVLDCCSQKKLLPLQAKYFLFLSDGSRKKLQEEIDEFSDSYYWDLDLQDLKQVLSNVKGSEDSRLIEYYKGKYCPKEKWSRFRGCSVHFLPLASKIQLDYEILSTLIQRRLRNEVCWGGGKISEAVADATHLIVLEVPGQALDLHAITEGLSAAEKRLLRKRSFSVLSSKWLEDCLERDRKLPEDLYKIHLTVADSSVNDEGHENGAKDHFSDSESGEKLNPSHEVGAPSNNVDMDADDKGPTSRKKRDAVRKRGRPLHESTKRGAAQARMIRPRLGKKPLKISEYVSDDENGSARRGSPSATARRGRIGIAQPRPTRPHRGKKPLKISRDGSDFENSSASDVDKDVKASRDTRERGTVAEKTAETFEGKAGGDVESSSLRGTSLSEKPTGYIPATREEKLNEDHRRSELEKEREEVGGDKMLPKFEIMTDPVQAMLLDMIPSLRSTKIEPTSRPSEEALTSRPSEEPLTSQPSEEGKPGLEAGAGPSEEMAVPKKKKVSYKDLAMELLKDW